jgi:hypothetical protein
MRARRVLTAVGEVELLRAWYLCPHCHNGHCPADVALDMEKTDLSPGVRRMLALVGSEAPFDHGRQQIELLAGLEVTAKAVERTAEVIGADIAAGEQREIQRALQLNLPIVVGQAIPILYGEMDGTGVPVRKTETEGRAGKVKGEPAHTREAKIGSIFTQTTWDKAEAPIKGASQEGYAIRDPDSTTYVAAIETAGEFGPRLYLEAWNRGWERAAKKVVLGDIFHARQHLWDVARKLYPGQEAGQKRWMDFHQDKLLDEGKIEELVSALRAIDSLNPELLEKIRVEADYLTTTRNACATPITAPNTSLSAPVLSKQAAKRSLAPVASSPACSRRFAARTQSSPYDAVTSTDGLRITGETGRQPAFHFHVAHPPLMPHGGILFGCQIERSEVFEGRWSSVFS